MFSLVCGFVVAVVFLVAARWLVGLMVVLLIYCSLGLVVGGWILLLYG